MTKLHSLFMGDGHPEDDNNWDHNVPTDVLVERVTTQLRAEQDGDELTIVVRTADTNEFIDD